MKDGLKTRQICLDIFHEIEAKNTKLDIIFNDKTKDLTSGERAFVRVILFSMIKKLPSWDYVIDYFVKKPIKNRKIQDILRQAIASIYETNIATYSIVDCAVELSSKIQFGCYKKMVNAVLRNVLRKKPDIENIINVPMWLFESWAKDWGQERARQISKAILNPPKVDIYIPNDVQNISDQIDGVMISENTLRLSETSSIENLYGYQQGLWWVQNRSASMAVEVCGDVRGKMVADFCCAPGGKTAGLCSKGAIVDAYDISKNRMERVAENMKRLGYQPNLYVSDALDIGEDKKYDLILIDAPCSATGTIQKHPDVLFNRQIQDIQKLHQVQVRLLKKAYHHLNDNGIVVYCTCSIQKDEGEASVGKVSDLYDVIPIDEFSEYKTSEGFIRTFPDQDLNGFFIAKLKKKNKILKGGK